MAKQISKIIMLAQIERNTDENGKPVTFELIFTKADGSIRIMTAQKVARHSSGERDSGENSKFKYNLKRKNILLLYDVKAKEHRSVLIDSIMHYNKMEVVH